MVFLFCFVKSFLQHLCPQSNFQAFYDKCPTMDTIQETDLNFFLACNENFPVLLIFWSVALIQGDDCPDLLNKNGQPFLCW